MPIIYTTQLTPFSVNPFTSEQYVDYEFAVG